MPTKQLKLKTVTDIFGTNVTLATKNGDKSFEVGTRVNYNPLKKLSKKLDKGYLFRSPNLKPENLSEIWPTVESFDDKAAFNAVIDTNTNEITAFMRIADKFDATTFAFTHSLFEKWSDEKQAEAEAATKVRKKAAKRLKVNDDGTVRVTVEVTSLSDLP